MRNGVTFSYRQARGAITESITDQTAFPYSRFSNGCDNSAFSATKIRNGTPDLFKFVVSADQLAVQAFDSA